MRNVSRKVIKKQNKFKRNKGKKNIKRRKDEEEKSITEPDGSITVPDPLQDQPEHMDNVQVTENVEAVSDSTPEKKGRKKRKSAAKKSNTDPETENDLRRSEDACDSDQSEHMEDVHVAKNDEQAVSDSNPKRKERIKGLSVHRTEASQTISEFNLLEVGKEKVSFGDLIKAATKGSGVFNKQLKDAKRLRTLAVPLSKPEVEKIKRTVAYEKVCNEVSKWDTIVNSNRGAETIIFPLKRPAFHQESLKRVSERFITKHPVEEAVSKLLQTSENVLDQEKTFTVAEEKALKAMSAQQARERHRELMRHKALISYSEAKARRQNRIKSKKYHRILKREKMKEMVKEFERLQEVDKKAALEKFLNADKLRMLERVTLRHRNTGKWAKHQKIRAKYNPDSRNNLKEDLDIGRQLRKKIEPSAPSSHFEMTSNDVDGQIEGIILEDNTKIRSNPKKGLHIGDKLQKSAGTPAESETTSNDVHDRIEQMIVEDSMKLCPNLKKDLHIQRKSKIEAHTPGQKKTDTPAKSEMKVGENPEEKFFQDNTEAFLIEDTGFGDMSSDVPMSMNTDNIFKSIAEKVTPNPPELKEKESKKTALSQVDETIAKDQINFSEPTTLDSLVPGDIDFNDEYIDDEDEDKEIVNIDQVLDVDDEVINEFQQDKKLAENANKPKGIDTFLPGWGSWGGPSIKISNKKRERFYIKPLEEPKPINTRAHVIINEEKDVKASVHQVSHLPYPFTNIHQFESNIRHPIGNTWNPQSSFHSLVTPKVVTQMGKIIDPIDSEDVVLEKKTTRVPLHKQKKWKKKAKRELKAF